MDSLVASDAKDGNDVLVVQKRRGLGLDLEIAWRCRGSSDAVDGSTLSATRRPRGSCSASYTTPIPPRPTSRMIRYSPKPRLKSAGARSTPANRPRLGEWTHAHLARIRDHRDDRPRYRRSIHGGTGIRLDRAGTRPEASGYTLPAPPQRVHHQVGRPIALNVFEGPWVQDWAC